jgi:ELWxxDGT repeat protein
MVKDINPTGDGLPVGLTVFNGALYFTATDGVHGRELWKIDGADAGTEMVQDISPSGDSGAFGLVVLAP